VIISLRLLRATHLQTVFTSKKQVDKSGQHAGQGFVGFGKEKAANMAQAI
jgi:hypothetical protein